MQRIISTQRPETTNVVKLKNDKTAVRTVAKVVVPLVVAAADDVAKNASNSKTVNAAKTVAKVATPVPYAISKYVDKKIDDGSINKPDLNIFKKLVFPILDLLD